MIDGPGDPGPQYVAQCETEARQAVDRARLVGYDFIKVYSRLQRDFRNPVREGLPTIHPLCRFSRQCRVS
jgi:hypothetical protein